MWTPHSYFLGIWPRGTRLLRTRNGSARRLGCAATLPCPAAAEQRRLIEIARHKAPMQTGQHLLLSHRWQPAARAGSADA